MTTKDRLKEYLKYKKVGRNKFEAAIGVSIGYISTKAITITSDVIEKVCAYFPELNIDWLITGRGEMEFTEVGLLQPSPDLITALKETIASQRLTIEAQREAIEAITKKMPVQNRKEVEMEEI
ncbi:hypothetical protein Barb4_03289 [Bacteroidales bacterium Barb4]|nr:hypothetical protein Barb4_03289 [Bacteroidales bacterium Barb4]